jgi:hypothetical protein
MFRGEELWYPATPTLGRREKRNEREMMRLFFYFTQHAFAFRTSEKAPFYVRANPVEGESEKNQKRRRNVPLSRCPIVPKPLGSDGTHVSRGRSRTIPHPLPPTSAPISRRITMLWDLLLVLCVSLGNSFAIEGVSWLFIYRTEEYQRVKQRVERLTVKGIACVLSVRWHTRCCSLVPTPPFLRTLQWRRRKKS